MKKWYIENLNNPEPGKYPAYEINISSEKEANICTVWYSNLFSDKAKQNALLISKAPELLKMLNYFVKEFDGLYHNGTEINNKIEEAKKLIKETTEI